MKDYHKPFVAGNKGLLRAFPIIFAAAIVLGGCVASQQDVRTLDLRLRTINNRLDNVNRDLGDLHKQTKTRAEKDSVKTLQKNLARSSADLDRLRSEILKLKGNMEEVAHHSTINREESQDYINDLGKRLAQAEKQLGALSKSNSATEKRISAIETTINDLTAQLNSRFEAINEAIKGLGQETTAIRGLIQKMNEEKARLAAEAAAQAAREAEEKAQRARTPKNITPSKNKKKPGSEATKVAPITNTAAAKTVEKRTAKADDPAAHIYAEGQAAFKAGKYRDAYAKFSSYLEKYPKSKLAGNARFWLGDCLYQQKEYALAILEYQKVVDDYRNHPKQPAALLKQGLAFEKLADRKTAKIVYLKLLKLYPGKPEADLAKKRLDAIG